MGVIEDGFGGRDAYAGISSAKKLLIIHIGIQRLAHVIRMDQSGYFNLSGLGIDLDFYKNTLPAHAVWFLYRGRFVCRFTDKEISHFGMRFQTTRPKRDDSSYRNPVFRICLLKGITVPDVEVLDLFAKEGRSRCRNIVAI